MSQKKKKTTRKKRRVDQKPKKKMAWGKALYGPRPNLQEGNQARLRQWFWGLSAFVLLSMLLLSTQNGINGDDKFQNLYSEHLTDYYLSFGADDKVLYNEEEGYQKFVRYYGGLFDLTTGLVNRVLGNEPLDPAYHQVRHIFIALFGFLGFLFGALFVRELAGWRGALIAMAVFALCPRVLGHALMNSKDIPFAAGYMVSLYYLFRILRDLPGYHWRNLLGFVLGATLAIGTRVGGVLIFFYAGLFMGIDFLVKVLLPKEPFKLVLRYAAILIGTSLGSFLLALLFWPYGLQSPLEHTQEAFNIFSEFSIQIRLLFQGDNILSDEAPGYYPLLWMGMTLSLPVLLGLALALVQVRGLFKDFAGMGVGVLLFAGVFPIAYVILKDSNLYDGWRHLLFAGFPLLVLSALAWEHLIAAVEQRQSRNRYFALGLLGALALPALLFILRNPFYPYVYFNPLAGGLQGAYGYYETDYWGISVKQALSWMEEEGILHDDMEEKLQIGTSFYYNTRYQLKAAYRDKVEVNYVRFNSRYDEPWDYGIFPSRFIRGAHLRSGNWPNSRTVERIEANGVPLVAIEKNEQNLAHRGMEAIKSRDWAAAAEALSQETALHPDNELAWINLANAYLKLKQFQKAVEAAEQAQEVAPEVEGGLFYEGLAYLNTGRAERASDAFKRLLRVNSDYYVAHYYLGLIYENQKQYREAFEQAKQAVEDNPRFKAGYEMAARILRTLGDEKAAAQYQQMANRL